MSLANYQKTQATTNPRQAEYRLFAEVTRALMEVKDGPRDDAFHKAAHWNLRMWLAFQEDLSSPDNKLTDEIKAGIISLSIWVEKETFRILNGESKLDDMIEINRTIMAGLAN